MFRKRTPPPPEEPADRLADLERSVVPPRFLPLVDGAVDAYRRWEQVTARVAAGPLADRLGMLGDQVADGVIELAEAAQRVGETEHVLEALDPAGATAAYKQAKRQATEGAAPRELEALEARFASVQRMMNLVDDAEAELRVLHARLLAAVARCAEVAITADSTGLTAIGEDLEGVVVQLGALRSALVDLED